MYRLHATIFQGYRDWCHHVDLPERILQLELQELRKGGEAVVSWDRGGCGQHYSRAAGWRGCWRVLCCWPPIVSVPDLLLLLLLLLHWVAS